MSDTSSKDTEPVPASRPQNIPVGWETRRLSELATNHDGKRVPLKQSDRERRRGDYPYYGASGIIDSIDGFLFDGDYVLLGEDGENVVSRHLPLAFRVTGKFWVNNHAHVYEPFQNVDIRFLVGLLDATDFSGLVSGSAQPKLTQEALQRLRFVVPPYGEQRAIAAVLDTIDDAIQKTEQIIAKLQQVKQGLLHDLLTRGIDDNGELRDPERHPEQFQDSPLGRIPKGWRTDRLDSVADVIDPNPSHRNPVYTTFGFPFISTVEFVEPDDVLVETPRRVAESTVREQEARCAFRESSIGFSRKGTIGATRFLPSGVRFALLDSLCVINARYEIDAGVLIEVLRSRPIRNQIDRLTMGVALQQVSISRVRSITVPLPPPAEQLRLADVVLQSKNRVRLEWQALEMLKRVKAGISDDLLTGRVRTTSLPEFSA
jgi:type I restriction enzyme S subunit